MKKIKIISIIIIIFYLIWSFINLNFDPYYWELFGRITYIISIFITYILYNDEKKLKEKW